MKSYLVDSEGSVNFDYIKTGENSDKVAPSIKNANVDGSMQIDIIEGVEMAYYLQKYEGIEVGLGAAMNICAAVKLAK